MGKSVASRFDHLDVERSMLLGVVVDDDQLTLELDFCLEPSHPAYEKPGSDEDCCFHPGTIRFGGITSLMLKRTDHPDTQRRRHAIRAFSVDGARCSLSSDWGAIQLQARSIRVVIE